MFPQVDAKNAQLLEQHVCCACAEMPVTEEEDGCYFGQGLSQAMDSLVAQGITQAVKQVTERQDLYVRHTNPNGGPLTTP